jgi:hypothetical protein
LSSELKNVGPKDLKIYEAILRYCECDMTLSAESFVMELKEFENAMSAEPDCGQLWAMLGRLYANMYSLDYPDFEMFLEKSTAYAQKREFN